MFQFLQNLKSGLKLAVFRKVRAEDFSISLDQAVYLIFFELALVCARDYITTPAASEFNIYALSDFALYLCLFLLAGYAIARFIGRPSALLDLIVITASALPIVYLLEVVLKKTLPFAGDDLVLQQTYLYGSWAIFIWYLFVLLLCVKTAVQHTWLKTMALWIFLGVIAVVPQFYLIPAVFWWDTSGDELEEVVQPVINVEQVFYAQAAMLERAEQRLLPQRPGVADLYFVGFGGYAFQDVFMKEVNFTKNLFDRRFDTEGRSVALINNVKTTETDPIASAHNLNHVLKHVGSVMDKEEDVLFLFLTSHGGRKEGVSVSFWPLSLNELPPAKLKTMLDESGIKWRVVVVSACYSGVYLSALKDEHTLIMTAASAERNSFGCSNENDFTYFGNALFNKELQHTFSFTQAFREAAKHIAERELKEALEPSQPQMVSTPAVEEKLQELEARLAAQVSAGEVTHGP